MGDISRATMARLGEALDRVGRRMNRATNERLDELREEVGRHGGRLDDLRGEMSRHGGALDELRGDISRQGDQVLDRVVEFEIRSRRDIVYAGD